MIETFDSKDPTATELFTIDVVARLRDDETISTATSVITQLDGPTDSGVASMVSGATTIDGSQITQKITAGLNGADYLWVLTVTTSLSQTFPIKSRIRVRLC